jgi:hypothetical protein
MDEINEIEFGFIECEWQSERIDGTYQKAGGERGECRD